MINVIVPITKDVEEFSAFVSKYANKTTKFFVGVTESLAAKFDCKKKDVEVHIYKDGARVEEIVNALGSCKREKGKLLIARRPLSDDEYTKLTTSNKDIVSLKAVRSKFATKFKNFARKLIKKVFAFSYFEDISAICYGESMYELLSVCPNLSNASRLNRYVGVSVEEIETEAKPVRKEYGRAENIMNLLLGTVFFLGTILTIIFLGVTLPKIKALYVVLMVLWVVVALVCQIVALVNFTRTVTVGQLDFGRVEEIIIKKENNK